MSVLNNEQGIYPLWKTFLTESFTLKPKERILLNALLKANRYEEAASHICDCISVEKFNDGIKRAFDPVRLDGLSLPDSVMLLPQLFHGPVITTNLDLVLEKAWKKFDIEFENIITPVDHSQFARSINSRRPFLIKLHGSIEEESNYVITKEQYDRKYDGANGHFDSSEGFLNNLRRVVLGSRLLFIGSSLESDRFLKVFEDLKKKDKEIYHYAILPKPSLNDKDNTRDSDDIWIDRVRNLAQSYGIRVIWYPNGKHESVKLILEQLLAQRQKKNDRLSSLNLPNKRVDGLMNYVSSFSFDQENLDESLDSFLYNVSQNINSFELVDRITVKGPHDEVGAKFRILFKNKIEDINLMRRSGNLGSASQKANLKYKEFLRRIFMSSSRGRFLILGEAGSGKTSLTYFMVDDILRDFKSSGNFEGTKAKIAIRIPFFVFNKLGQVVNPGIFSEIYDQLEESKELILNWMNKGKVCLIFDGLDELLIDTIEIAQEEWDEIEKNRLLAKSTKVDKSEFVEFSNNGGDKVEFILDLLVKTYPKCSLLFTSRLHYYDSRIQHFLGKGDFQFQIYQIQPLSVEQRNIYIKSRVDGDSVLVEDIVRTIENTPNLYDLAPTPVLLEMIVTIMIWEKDRGVTWGLVNQAKEEGRFYLYQQIVNGWCELHSQKVMRKLDLIREKLSLEIKRSFYNSNDTDNLPFHVHLLSELLMIVALAMFDINNESHGGLLIRQGAVRNYMIKIAHIANEDADLLLDLMNSVYSESEVAIERKDSNSGTPYSFSHKTILEFLVSKAVYEKLVLHSKSDSGQNHGILVQKIDLLDLLSVPLDFHQEEEVLKFTATLVESNGQQLLANETLLKLLLQEEKLGKDGRYSRVQNKNIIKLLGYLNQKDLSTSKDSVLERLNLSRVHKKMFGSVFKNRDCTGLRLSDTNFGGQDFSGATLESGELRGAGLSRTWLVNSNFRNVDLTAAYLGQSASIWSFELLDEGFLLDDGSGTLSIATHSKGLTRSFKSSDRDKIIWDISCRNIKGMYLAVSAQQGNNLSFLLVNSRKSLQFHRPFNETLFACCVGSTTSKVFFAGAKGIIYLIDDLETMVDNHLESDMKANGLYRLNYPESYKNKNHIGTIFGLGLSKNEQFLYSCGVDRLICCWRANEFESNPRLSSKLLEPAISPFDVRMESHSDGKNALRKLRVINYEGKEYVLVGSQQGWLIVLQTIYKGNIPLKFERVAVIKDFHDDWLLDIGFSIYKKEGVIITVSGDHSAKAILLSEILKKGAKAKSHWERYYKSAILSICVKNDVVFFGTYEGSVLSEEIDYIYQAFFTGQSRGVFSKAHVYQSVDMLPTSVVRDASGAFFTGVNGLNKGRMLLLKSKGAVIDPSKNINEYKTDFFLFQHEVIEEFIENVTLQLDHDEADLLEDFLIEFEKNYLDRIEKSLKEFRTFLLKLDDLSVANKAIDIYHEFTSLKIVLGTIAMVYYWFGKKVEAEPGEVDFKGVVVSKLQSIVSGDVNSRLRYLDMFKLIQQSSRQYLEEKFTREIGDDEIFNLCYGDYTTNQRLKSFCDFIAGVETNDQIPASIRNEHFHIDDIWTRMSNEFWTGATNIAETYFEDFTSKIYKCCAQAQEFLIDEVAMLIKAKLANSRVKKSSIHYHDFATGKKGTIAVGVYNRLSKSERSRVIITASDSSKELVEELTEYLQANNIPIAVDVLNMANVEGKLADSSLDVITQCLGGHHLPKQQIEKMYESFFGFLRVGGHLGACDVMVQPIKILAGLPDDVGAPEYPYDVRNFNGLVHQEVSQNLKSLASRAFPSLGMTEGFYTAQIYEKVSSKAAAIHI